MDWDSKLSLSAIIFCLILGLGHSFYRAFDIQSLVSYNQLRMYHTLYPARLDKSITRATRSYIRQTRWSDKMAHFNPGRRETFKASRSGCQLDNMWASGITSNYTYVHGKSPMGAWYGEVTNRIWGNPFRRPRGPGWHPGPDATWNGGVAGHYDAFMRNGTLRFGCSAGFTGGRWVAQCCFIKDDEPGYSVKENERKDLPRLFGTHNYLVALESIEPYMVHPEYRTCNPLLDFNKTHYRKGCEKNFRSVAKWDKNKPLPEPTTGFLWGYGREMLREIMEPGYGLAPIPPDQTPPPWPGYGSKSSSSSSSAVGNTNNSTADPNSQSSNSTTGSQGSP